MFFALWLDVFAWDNIFALRLDVFCGRFKSCRFGAFGNIGGLLQNFLRGDGGVVMIEFYN